LIVNLMLLAIGRKENWSLWTALDRCRTTEQCSTAATMMDAGVPSSLPRPLFTLGWA